MVGKIRSVDGLPIELFSSGNIKKGSIVIDNDKFKFSGLGIDILLGLGNNLLFEGDVLLGGSSSSTITLGDVNDRVVINNLSSVSGDVIFSGNITFNELVRCLNGVRVGVNSSISKVGNDLVVGLEGSVNDSINLKSSGIVKISSNNSNSIMEFYSGLSKRGSIGGDGSISFSNGTLSGDLGVGGSISLNSGTLSTKDGSLCVVGSSGLLLGDNASNPIVSIKGGKVGIGTSSPGQLLHVGDSTNSITKILVHSTSGVNGTSVGIGFGNNNGLVLVAKSSIFHRRFSGSGVGDLVFAVNNVNNDIDVTTDDERMVLTKDGNLGVGVKNPIERLEVGGNLKVEKLITKNTYLGGYVDIPEGVDVRGNVYNIDGLYGTDCIKFGIGKEVKHYLGSNGLHLGSSLPSGEMLEVEGNEYVSGNIGVGIKNGSGKVHIVKSKVSGAFYDGSVTQVVEDIDSRLQIVSSSDGDNASTLILSNQVSNVLSKSWILHNSGDGRGGRFDIGYRESIVSGENLSEVMTSYLTILKDGKVGIGDTNPSERLVVNGNLKLLNNTLSNDVLTFGSYSGAGFMVSNQYGYVSITPLNSSFSHIYTDRPNFIFNKPIYELNGNFHSYSSSDFKIHTGTTRRMTILNSNGCVGIGTDSPSHLLHLKSSRAGDGSYVEGILLENNNVTVGEVAVSFKNTSTGTNLWMIGLNQDNVFRFGYGSSFVNGSHRFSITSDGKVGIGVDSPSEKLHIAGNLKFEGSYGISTSSGNLVINPNSGITRINSVDTYLDVDSRTLVNYCVLSVGSGKSLKLNGTNLDLVGSGNITINGSNGVGVSSTKGIVVRALTDSSFITDTVLSIGGSNVNVSGITSMSGSSLGITNTNMTINNTSLGITSSTYSIGGNGGTISGLNTLGLSTKVLTMSGSTSYGLSGGSGVISSTTTLGVSGNDVRVSGANSLILESVKGIEIVSSSMIIKGKDTLNINSNNSISVSGNLIGLNSTTNMEFIATNNMVVNSRLFDWDGGIFDVLASGVVNINGTTNLNLYSSNLLLDSDEIMGISTNFTLESSGLIKLGCLNYDVDVLGTYSLDSVGMTFNIGNFLGSISSLDVDVSLANILGTSFVTTLTNNYDLTADYINLNAREKLVLETKTLEYLIGEYVIGGDKFSVSSKEITLGTLNKIVISNTELVKSVVVSGDLFSVDSNLVNISSRTSMNLSSIGTTTLSGGGFNVNSVVTNINSSTTNISGGSVGVTSVDNISISAGKGLSLVGSSGTFGITTLGMSGVSGTLTYETLGINGTNTTIKGTTSLILNSTTSIGINGGSVGISGSSLDMNVSGITSLVGVGNVTLKSSGTNKVEGNITQVIGTNTTSISGTNSVSISSTKVVDISGSTLNMNVSGVVKVTTSTLDLRGNLGVIGDVSVSGSGFVVQSSVSFGVISGDVALNSGGIMKMESVGKNTLKGGSLDLISVGGVILSGTNISITSSGSMLVSSGTYTHNGTSYGLTTSGNIDIVSTNGNSKVQGKNITLSTVGINSMSAGSYSISSVGGYSSTIGATYDVTSTGNMLLKSLGSNTLDGNSVVIRGTSSVGVSGGLISLNSSGNLDLVGSSNVSLQGLITSIYGGTLGISSEFSSISLGNDLEVTTQNAVFSCGGDVTFNGINFSVVSSGNVSFGGDLITLGSNRVNINPSLSVSINSINVSLGGTNGTFSVSGNLILKGNVSRFESIGNMDVVSGDILNISSLNKVGVSSKVIDLISTTSSKLESVTTSIKGTTSLSVGGGSVGITSTSSMTLNSGTTLGVTSITSTTLNSKVIDLVSTVSGKFESVSLVLKGTTSTQLMGNGTLTMSGGVVSTTSTGNMSIVSGGTLTMSGGVVSTTSTGNMSIVSGGTYGVTSTGNMTFGAGNISLNGTTSLGISGVTTTIGATNLTTNVSEGMVLNSVNTLSSTTKVLSMSGTTSVNISGGTLTLGGTTTRLSGSSVTIDSTNTMIVNSLNSTNLTSKRVDILSSVGTKIESVELILKGENTTIDTLGILNISGGDIGVSSTNGIGINSGNGLTLESVGNMVLLGNEVNSNATTVNHVGGNVVNIGGMSSTNIYSDTLVDIASLRDISLIGVGYRVESDTHNIVSGVFDVSSSRTINMLSTQGTKIKGSTLLLESVGTSTLLSVGNAILESRANMLVKGASMDLSSTSSITSNSTTTTSLSATTGFSISGGTLTLNSGGVTNLNSGGVTNLSSVGVISLKTGSNDNQLILGVDGNVGIGTSSPSSKLHIGGNVKVDGNGSSIGGTNVGNASLLVGGTLGIDGNEVVCSSALFIGTSTNNNITICPNNVVVATFTSSNVGIGISSPTSKLHVVGNVSIGDNTSYNNVVIGKGTSISGYSGVMEYVSNTTSSSGVVKYATYLKNNVGVGTTRHDLLVGGYVGIGITSPSRALDVVGDIGASGTYYGKVNSSSGLISGWNYDTNNFYDISSNAGIRINGTKNLGNGYIGLYKDTSNYVKLDKEGVSLVVGGTNIGKAITYEGVNGQMVIDYTITGSKLDKIPPESPKNIRANAVSESMGDFSSVEVVWDSSILEGNNSLYNTGFESTSNWSNENQTLSVSGGVGICTAGSSVSYSVLTQNIKDIKANDKLFIKARVRTKSSASSLFIGIISGSNINPGGSGTINNTVADTWYDIYGIVSVSSSGSAYFKIYQMYSSAIEANGKIMEVSEVLVVNLTNMYGSGVPSLEVCNMILNYRSKDIAGYRLYLRDGNNSYNQVANVGKDINRYTIRDLIPNRTYYVGVSCYDLIGNESGMSVSSSFNVEGDTLPPAPVGTINAVAGAKMFSIRWSEVTQSWDNGSGSIVDGSNCNDLNYYELQRKYLFNGVVVGDWETINKAYSISVVDRDVEYDYTYYYRVRAVDTSGNVAKDSSNVDIWSVVNAGKPGKLNTDDIEDGAITADMLDIGDMVKHLDTNNSRLFRFDNTLHSTRGFRPIGASGYSFDVGRYGRSVKMGGGSSYVTYGNEGLDFKGGIISFWFKADWVNVLTSKVVLYEWGEYGKSGVGSIRLEVGVDNKLTLIFKGGSEEKTLKHQSLLLLGGWNHIAIRWGYGKDFGQNFLDKITNGVCVSSTSTTLVMDEAGSNVLNYYKDMYIRITKGAGEGQVKRITSYNNTTKTLTLESAWGVLPNISSEYEILVKEGAELYINGTSSDTKINLYGFNSGTISSYYTLGNSYTKNLGVKGYFDEFRFDNGINMESSEKSELVSCYKGNYLYYDVCEVINGDNKLEDKSVSKRKSAYNEKIKLLSQVDMTKFSGYSVSIVDGIDPSSNTKLNVRYILDDIESGSEVIYLNGQQQYSNIDEIEDYDYSIKRVSIAVNNVDSGDIIYGYRVTFIDGKEIDNRDRVYCNYWIKVDGE